MSLSLQFSVLFFLWQCIITIASVAADSMCSANQTCATGCCSTSGYCGFGPDYCGQGNCVSTCDAVSQCGPFAAPGNFDCPLNVCCSQFGFCGTSPDHCGTGCTSNCGAVNEPSCSGSSSDARVIGYYSSGAYTRDCDVWGPENIDASAWTHLIYAFATIGNNYTLEMGNSTNDNILYPRFTGLKRFNPSLSTMISVGGWDEGGAIFSDMVSTKEKRSSFINSAIDFMSAYGFDGIDIDWEYPASSDRDGVPADTQNYVSFAQEAREAFGDEYILTVTLSCGFSNLKGVNVTGMEPYVDWFHFMTYDIHGTWDASDPTIGVRPHTNLTEISDGLDLLWRNNIDPSKVALGEAFYGHSFTLTNSSCTAPGCPFSVGGNPGACTKQSGILSDAEIQSIILDNDITPILDKEAAVKYFSWDEDQWVSYDDAETFELKREFANSKCLGGRFTWSVDLANSTSKVPTPPWLEGPNNNNNTGVWSLIEDHAPVKGSVAAHLRQHQHKHKKGSIAP